MTNPEELLALAGCPFCGGEADVEIDDADFYIARGFCTKCGACGPYTPLAECQATEEVKAEVVRLWNARASTKEPTP